MGPDSSSTSLYYFPSDLNPGQDRKKFRHEVEAWVGFTKARVVAGDNISKANQSTMGYMLYQSLQQDYEKVIDHAIESDKFVIMGAPDQDVVVQFIIALVEEDTPIHITNHILVAYQNLQKCIRRKHEPPSKFADRFVLCHPSTWR